MFEMRPYNNRKNEMQYYNPFKEFEELEKNFFDNDFGFLRGFNNDRMTGFGTDIKDNGNAFVLEADLPGFDKKDIHIDLNGDQLTVSAERHSECEQEDKKNKYLRCERSYGSYCRSFDISGVNADEIKAKYDNGVLTLTMPKKPEVVEKSRHLEIE